MLNKMKEKLAWLSSSVGDRRTNAVKIFIRELLKEERICAVAQRRASTALELSPNTCCANCSVANGGSRDRKSVV